jgi:hypothetical protein
VGATETLVGLVQALAWPVVVVIVLLLFRTSISEAIQTRVTKVKGPGFEIELAQAKQDAEVAAASLTDRGLTAVRLSGTIGLPDSVRSAGTSKPDEAVLRAYQVVEDRLWQGMVVATTANPNWRFTATQIIDAALTAGLISPATGRAVGSLAQLRFAVAHSNAEVSASEATQYMDVAEQVLMAVDQDIQHAITTGRRLEAPRHPAAE